MYGTVLLLLLVCWWKYERVVKYLLRACFNFNFKIAGLRVLNLEMLKNTSIIYYVLF